MAQDYKDRIPAYRRKNHRRAARAWKLAGVAILGIAGLSALGLHFFSRTGAQEGAAGNTVTMTMPSPDSAQKPAADPAGDKQPTAVETPAKALPETVQPVEPRFTFYKVLPEKEVIIPENEIKTLKREEENRSKQSKVGVYMVQAGSFTSQQDAEKLKAQLAQVKIKAKLEMIKLENTVWFRVKTGPYASLADADKVRQYLRSNKIDSVVQKATP
jgi:cell division protein FtsN